MTPDRRMLLDRTPRCNLRSRAWNQTFRVSSAFCFGWSDEVVLRAAVAFFSVVRAHSAAEPRIRGGKWLHPRRAVVGRRRRLDHRRRPVKTAVGQPGNRLPGFSRSSRRGVPRSGAEQGAAIRVRRQFRGDRAPRRAKCTDQAPRGRPRDLESRQRRQSRRPVFVSGQQLPLAHRQILLPGAADADRALRGRTAAAGR